MPRLSLLSITHHYQAQLSKMPTTRDAYVAEREKASVASEAVATEASLKND